MHIQFKIAIMATAAIALVTPITAAAVTVTSTQGDDYSFNSQDDRYLYVCDYESDSHGVHADYVNNVKLTGRVDDNNGSFNSCAGRDLWSLRLVQHRAVEGVPFKTDYYGSWAYTGR